MAGYRDRGGNVLQDFAAKAADAGKWALEKGWDLIQTSWNWISTTAFPWITDTAIPAVSNGVSSAFNNLTNRGNSEREQYTSRNVNYTAPAPTQTENLTVEAPAVPDARQTETSQYIS